MRRGAPLAGMLQMATVARYACPLEETHMQPTSAKPIQQHAPDPQDYLMRIADLLSDDPFLLAVLGGSFKVSAEYDAKKRFVKYLFTPVKTPKNNIPFR